ncbi:hypothetical protein C8F04DRAFT_1295818 [Mycena alexandri]|uniref:RING-type E3 ubiquitin transferase n=1 Tax=Mycena alexandri TaxID=1745969 RepID=A0AAD6WW85_9AGAR|nr:hypothetical protein C8F04DRAFT_1295818 [Mycena alexandri]
MSPRGSPPTKRVKLESPLTPIFVKTSTPEEPQLEPEEEEADEDRCSICLQEVVDRTVVPLCAHEFCFDCLIVWTDQSRRCPLCSQGIGSFLIHKIRSRYDYQKHYLNPLPTSPGALRPLPPRQNRFPRRRPRESEWGRRDRTESDEADKLDRSISKRRWIYEHDLYAKHVASNAYTRYRPYPTPVQFAASPDLISRTTMFLRRELQFLTQFIISIMKAIDIRSESAVKLLSEFLDLDAPYIEGGRHVNAEHFAHEVYSYVRSPYKDLFVYDSVVQYEVTAEVPALDEEPRRRWREPSRSPSPAILPRDARPEGNRRVRSRSLSSSRSRRRHASSRDRQLNEHTSRGSDKRQLHNASRHRESNEQQLDTSGYLDTGAERTIARIQHNHPRSPPPTPGGATESTETLDPKGKARSIPGALFAKEESSIPLVSRAEIAVEFSPSPLAEVPLAQASRKAARVRNRSLFESVHAHLGGPSRKERDTRTLQTMPGSSKFPNSLDAEETGSVPSLLTRLSDPEPPGDTRLFLTPDDSVTTKVPERASSVSVEQELPSTSHTKPYFSAPEIMARTRVRLAKLATIDDPGPKSTSFDGRVVPVRSSSSSVAAAVSLGMSLWPFVAESSNSQGSRQDGNSDISTSSSGHIGEPSRRAKLLGRLEEEKQKARDVAGSPTHFTAPVDAAVAHTHNVLDRISQEERSIAFPVDSGTTSVDAAESRLRRQAQLRVRLAAEKREHSKHTER